MSPHLSSLTEHDINDVFMTSMRAFACGPVQVHMDGWLLDWMFGVETENSVKIEDDYTNC